MRSKASRADAKSRLIFDNSPSCCNDKRSRGNASSTRRMSLQRSEEHTSELQSRSDLVCRLLLEKKKKIDNHNHRSCCQATPLLSRRLQQRHIPPGHPAQTLAALPCTAPVRLPTYLAHWSQTAAT